MSSSLDVSRPQVISDRREIGQAGCFRFFECFIDDRSAAIAQEAVDRSVSALAVRRLAREVDIAPYFRDRTVAPFASLSQARALAVWNDNGLRPAIQRARALPGGAADLLAVFIRVGEAAIDLHSVGLVHGALFPFGVWTDAGFGSVRFADCSLAFAIKDQIPLTAPWGLASDSTARGSRRNKSVMFRRSRMNARIVMGLASSFGPFWIKARSLTTGHRRP